MEHFGHYANLYRGPLRRTDLSHPAQFFGPVRGSDHLHLPDDWARRHHYCREKLEELHAVGWALCDRSTQTRDTGDHNRLNATTRIYVA